MATYSQAFGMSFCIASPHKIMPKAISLSTSFFLCSFGPARVYASSQPVRLPADTGDCRRKRTKSSRKSPLHPAFLWNLPSFIFPDSESYHALS